MLPVEELRRRQEQRLLPPLTAWEEAKKKLEEAIALAEAREHEYRLIAEDVQRKLGALQMVIGMTQELDEARSIALIEQSAPSHRPLQNGLVRVSSRRLFAANWRSKETSLSILPAGSTADSTLKTA